jgi:hypothetical protein
LSFFGGRRGWIIMTNDGMTRFRGKDLPGMYVPQPTLIISFVDESWGRAGRGWGCALGGWSAVFDS